MRFHQHSPYADWGFVDATIQAREELGDQVDDTRFTEHFAAAVGEMAAEQGITFELTLRDVRHALRLGRMFPPHRRGKGQGRRGKGWEAEARVPSGREPPVPSTRAPPPFPLASSPLPLPPPPLPLALLPLPLAPAAAPPPSAASATSERKSPTRKL